MAPHSPIIKYIYAPLEPGDLADYRKDITVHERSSELRFDKHLPEVLIDIAWTLQNYAEFLEEKLEIKVRYYY